MPVERQRTVQGKNICLCVKSIEVNRSRLPVRVDLDEVIGSKPKIYMLYIWYGSRSIYTAKYPERTCRQNYKTLLDKLDKGEYKLKLTSDGLRMKLV